LPAFSFKYLIVIEPTLEGKPLKSAQNKPNFQRTNHPPEHPVTK
jgi:hypothetical protein